MISTYKSNTLYKIALKRSAQKKVTAYFFSSNGKQSRWFLVWFFSVSHFWYYVKGISPVLNYCQCWARDNVNCSSKCLHPNDRTLFIEASIGWQLRSAGKDTQNNVQNYSMIFHRVLPHKQSPNGIKMKTIEYVVCECVSTTGRIIWIFHASNTNCEVRKSNTWKTAAVHFEQSRTEKKTTRRCGNYTAIFHWRKCEFSICICAITTSFQIVYYNSTYIQFILNLIFLKFS